MRTYTNDMSQNVTKGYRQNNLANTMVFTKELAKLA